LFLVVEDEDEEEEEDEDDGDSEEEYEPPDQKYCQPETKIAYVGYVC
jgi:hypothetical protein